MTKVYTVELGCIYEGGWTAFTTSNLLSALKYAYNQRKKNIDQFFEDRDVISSACVGRQITAYDWCYTRKDKWCWESGSDYIKIKEWGDETRSKE